MRCCLPSSKMRKSFSSRSETKRPLSSVTVTGTMTSLTCTLMLFGCVAGLSDAAGAEGLACAHNLAVSHPEQTSTTGKNTRKNIGNLFRLYSACVAAHGFKDPLGRAGKTLQFTHCPHE